MFCRNVVFFCMGQAESLVSRFFSASMAQKCCTVGISQCQSPKMIALYRHFFSQSPKIVRLSAAFNYNRSKYDVLSAFLVASPPKTLYCRHFSVSIARKVKKRNLDKVWISSFFALWLIRTLSASCVAAE